MKLWIITVARKPLDSGSVADNIQKWGTGGLDIDKSRIGTAADLNPRDFDDRSRKAPKTSELYNGGEVGIYRSRTGSVPAGRWPSNLILQHKPACVHGGTISVKGNRSDTRPNGDGGRTDKAQWRFRPTDQTRRGYSKEDGTEEIDNWQCMEGCPVRDLGEQSGILTSGGRTGVSGSSSLFGGGRESCVGNPLAATTGTAARFFKQVQDDED